MRYYTVDNRNKMMVLEFPFNKELAKEIKSCSMDTHWNPELVCWRIPITPYTKERILSIIKEHKFTLKPTPELSTAKYDYSIPEALAEKLELVCTSRKFTYTPRPYQLEALYYAMKKGSFINGDDVGLGKTFEAIIYTEAMKAFPALFVVPASVKYNWAEKWAEIVGPHRTISVIESKESKKNPNNWRADVVIINYDIIGKKQGKGSTVKFPELLSTKWKMFGFDEGHFLKDDGSQRSKVARLITKKSNGIIQLLTGTPTMSRPSELWNLLVLIKKSHLIAESKEKFQQRYCGAYRTKYGLDASGATNILELNKVMRENCYLRREKRDVLTDLPDVETIILKTPITNKKEIDSATTNLYEYLLETKGEEAADRAMEAQALVALGVLRKLSIQGKLKAIEQYLNDWKQSGVKLVVFGLHREELDYLSDKFKCKLIAGGMSSKKKQETVKDWITNDDVFLFANMTSAGTGVDGLQLVCSNMLILELPWRPSDLTQVVGRLDRSGQKNATTVSYMLNDDSIDKQMWEMLQEKEINTEGVNKGVDLTKEESGMRIVLRKIIQKISN